MYKQNTFIFTVLVVMKNAFVIKVALKLDGIDSYMYIPMVT